MSWIKQLIGALSPYRYIIDYKMLEKERLDYCPACSSEVSKNAVIFSTLDRYGFPDTKHWCHFCDAFFLNPRLTSGSYQKFYDSGAYRCLISAYSGKEEGHSLPQKRVESLVAVLKPIISERQGGFSVLNVGGTRADFEVLSPFLNINKYLCLNPGESEAGSGYEVINSSFEDFTDLNNKFDLLFLLGTLNHLTLPGENFKKIASLMKSDSLFIFDFKDPVAKMLRTTQPIGALQFDHAVYPTRRTVEIMLLAAGMKYIVNYDEKQRLYTFIASTSFVESNCIFSDLKERAVIESLRGRNKKMPRGRILKVIRNIWLNIK